MNLGQPIDQILDVLEGSTLFKDDLTPIESHDT
jgi:hypothetical protein